MTRTAAHDPVRAANQKGSGETGMNNQLTLRPARAAGPSLGLGFAADLIGVVMLLLRDRATDGLPPTAGHYVRGRSFFFAAVPPTARVGAHRVNRVGDGGRITEHLAAVDTHSLLLRLGAPPTDTAA